MDNTYMPLSKSGNLTSFSLTRFSLTAITSLSKSGNLTNFSHYTSPIPLHPPLFFLSKFSSAHQAVKYRLAICRYCIY